MIAFVAQHLRLILVALAIAGSFVGGRCSAPDKYREVQLPPVRDLKVENELRAELAQLQKRLSESKSRSSATAKFTAPDGSKVELACKDAQRQGTKDETAQTGAVASRNALELKDAPTVTAPGRLDMHFAVGPAVIGKPRDGTLEVGAMLGARLGSLRTDLLVTTSPSAPLKSPTVGVIVSAEF